MVAPFESQQGVRYATNAQCLGTFDWRLSVAEKMWIIWFVFGPNVQSILFAQPPVGRKSKTRTVQSWVHSCSDKYFLCACVSMLQMYTKAVRSLICQTDFVELRDVEYQYKWALPIHTWICSRTSIQRRSVRRVSMPKKSTQQTQSIHNLVWTVCSFWYVTVKFDNNKSDANWAYWVNITTSAVARHFVGVGGRGKGGGGNAPTPPGHGTTVHNTYLHLCFPTKNRAFGIPPQSSVCILSCNGTPECYA